jgi:hypothetical protein
MHWCCSLEVRRKVLLEKVDTKIMVQVNLPLSFIAAIFCCIRNNN